ncbi:prolipoprotein diacylglyceryl transferase [Cytophagaceae bacterium ABcell3]|nr:prolipoprotein diacylglyceryl transferase [Cytophagaceae bacterium ABcell3]
MLFNYIYWDIQPEIFNILGFPVRYYGLLFVTGLILSVYVMKWIFRKEHIPAEHLDKLTLYSIIGIIAGARLGHCLFYEPEYFLANPLEMFLPIQKTPEGVYFFSGFSGLASHGGGLGVLIALLFYSYKTKQPLIKTLDYMAIAAPLACVFIRMANLVNSEIIGYPTTKPWAFVFLQVDNQPRHPAQLYEAICYLMIFWLLLYLYRTANQKLGNGFFFGLCLSLIFISRFLIEFVKERQVAFEENLLLDLGQILSIPYIIAGAVFIIISLIKQKQQKSTAQLA